MWGIIKSYLPASKNVRVPSKLNKKRRLQIKTLLTHVLFLAKRKLRRQIQTFETGKHALELFVGNQLLINFFLRTFNKFQVSRKKCAWAIISYLSINQIFMYQVMSKTYPIDPVLIKRLIWNSNRSLEQIYKTKGAIRDSKKSEKIKGLSLTWHLADTVFHFCRLEKYQLVRCEGRQPAIHRLIETLVWKMLEGWERKKLPTKTRPQNCECNPVENIFFFWLMEYAVCYSYHWSLGVV